MTDKHTPGPWTFGPSSNPRNGSAWRDILGTGGEFSPSYVGEALEHDATLIAAAPDMLDALRDVEWAGGLTEPRCPSCDAMRDQGAILSDSGDDLVVYGPHEIGCALFTAIAKATGEGVKA